MQIDPFSLALAFFLTIAAVFSAVDGGKAFRRKL